MGLRFSFISESTCYPNHSHVPSAPVIRFFAHLHTLGILLISFREEVFGPVAPLLRFKTEDDAIRIANDTTAGIFTYFLASIDYFLSHITTETLKKIGLISFVKPFYC